MVEYTYHTYITFDAQSVAPQNEAWSWDPAIELLFVLFCFRFVSLVSSWFVLLLWLCLRTPALSQYMVNFVDRPGCSGNDGISPTRNGLELGSRNSLRPFIELLSSKTIKT